MSNDPDYYKHYYGKRRPTLFVFIVWGLISALLGGLLAIRLAPAVYGELKTPASNQVVIGEGNAPPIPPIVTPADPAAFPVVAIATAVGPTVVGIGHFRTQGSGFFGGSGGLTEVASGSGFIVDARSGYIVTNNHVIQGAEKIVVSLADGRNLEGTLVGGDSRTDLAVIKIADTKDLTSVQIGDSSKVQVGEPVVAIGNPGGQKFARSVTTGVISATNRVLNIEGEASFDLIQTDAAINPGNSGGPLVNYQGQVIGINSAKNQEAGFEGMGFAIPITDAMPTIQQLIEKGYASHPALLVQISNNYSAEYAQARGWPSGAYVMKVTADGPAAKAGIQAGDIITKVNGIEIQSSLDLTHELFKFKAGDQVSVTYFREGNSAEVEAVLAEITSDGRVIKQ
ncbi:MAG: trypsin-like peptidase domain-containing protein [Peptococcaceae bacterium]|jgi:serine protease Do|nr:trypsin-like peptidase domain-containing protein [Peptococcaceae bacterium]